jgi:hypothetical protein
LVEGRRYVSTYTLFYIGHTQIPFSRETYLNSYLVGEGLSGFVPSIAALIQVCDLKKQKVYLSIGDRMFGEKDTKNSFVTSGVDVVITIFCDFC